MARTNNLTNYLTDVADAIREKKGTTDTIPAASFDEEIKNLPSGGNNMLQQKIDLEGTAAYLFYNSYIKDFSFTSGLDLSRCSSVQRMFQSCYSVVTIPEYDASNAGSKYNTEAAIQSVFYSCSNLANFGGFKNLGKGYPTSAGANTSNLKFDVSGNSKLTHDSLMNIFNGLFDIASLGVKPQQVVIGTTNRAKLEATEEGRQAIENATNKGWNVS